MSQNKLEDKLQTFNKKIVPLVEELARACEKHEISLALGMEILREINGQSVVTTYRQGVFHPHHDARFEQAFHLMGEIDNDE